jgi:hypothetical protein
MNSSTLSISSNVMDVLTRNQQWFPIWDTGIYLLSSRCMDLRHDGYLASFCTIQTTSQDSKSWLLSW